MPGLSGMDLQAELSKAETSMPIVFITGHGDIPMSVEAMRKGAVHFLIKPFDDNDLLAAVREAVEKTGERKPNRPRFRISADASACLLPGI